MSWTLWDQIEVSGARSKRDRDNHESAPHQQPMKAGIPTPRSPSTDQKRVRREMQRRTASETRESVMNVEAAIIERLHRAATLQEQRNVQAELEAYRSAKTAAWKQQAEVDLSAQFTAQRREIHPHASMGNNMVSTDTDWLMDESLTPRVASATVANAMKAEASVWFRSRTAAVRADGQELAVQAHGFARRQASQYGEQSQGAYDTFMGEIQRMAGSDYQPGNGSSLPAGVKNKETFDDMAFPQNGSDQSSADAAFTSPSLQEGGPIGGDSKEDPATNPVADSTDHTKDGGNSAYTDYLNGTTTAFPNTKADPKKTQSSRREADRSGFWGSPFEGGDPDEHDYVSDTCPDCGRGGLASLSGKVFCGNCGYSGATTTAPGELLPYYLPAQIMGSRRTAGDKKISDGTADNPVSLNDLTPEELEKASDFNENHPGEWPVGVKAPGKKGSRTAGTMTIADGMWGDGPVSLNDLTPEELEKALQYNEWHPGQWPIGVKPPGKEGAADRKSLNDLSMSELEDAETWYQNHGEWPSWVKAPGNEKQGSMQRWAEDQSSDDSNFEAPSLNEGGPIEHGSVQPEVEPQSSQTYDKSGGEQSFTDQLNGSTTSFDGKTTASLRQVAASIHNDEPGINPDAMPFLAAMASLDSMGQSYAGVPARQVVSYFLESNPLRGRNAGLHMLALRALAGEVPEAFKKQWDKDDDDKTDKDDHGDHSGGGKGVPDSFKKNWDDKGSKDKDSDSDDGDKPDWLEKKIDKDSSRRVAALSDADFEKVTSHSKGVQRLTAPQVAQLVSAPSGQRPRVYGLWHDQIVSIQSQYHLDKYEAEAEAFWTTTTGVGDLISRASLQREAWSQEKREFATCNECKTEVPKDALDRPSTTHADSCSKNPFAKKSGLTTQANINAFAQRMQAGLR